MIYTKESENGEELGDVIDGAIDGADFSDSGLGSNDVPNSSRGAKLRRMSQRLRGAPKVDPEVYDM